MVDVVGEPQLDAAFGRAPDRVADDQLRGLAEVEVVLGEVERRLGAVEECRDGLSDRDRLLAAVRQGADLDALGHRTARSSTGSCAVPLLPLRAGGRLFASFCV